MVTVILEMTNKIETPLTWVGVQAPVTTVKS